MRIVLLISLFLSALCSEVIDNVSKGEILFVKHCVSCHTIGIKSNIGPDLNAASYKLTKREVRMHIENPTRILKDFDKSKVVMPVIPLSNDDIYALAEYIDSLEVHKIWIKSPIKPLHKF